ncbi:MAG: peptidylprolyl isomerase [Alphaproteobacteria bacterium]|nr:peptidylprolyl isomerase [Alphaproteobacteria bacterium]
MTNIPDIWRRVARAACLAASAVAIATSATAQDVQRIAAVVNEEVISIFDVQQRTQIVISSSGLPNTAETQRRVAPQVLRSLIDEALQTQEAERLNIRVNQNEIDDAIGRIEQTNRIPAGRFEDFLRRRGVSVEAAIDQIRANIAWQKLLSRTVVPTIEIGEEEIDTVIARIDATRGVEEYRVGEILLPVDNPADAGDIRDLARRLVQQIRTGADFAGVARQFSKSATAATGGDVGWIQPGELEPALNQAITALDVGGVSDPIDTADGIQIVTLIDRRTNDGPDESERAVELRQMLLLIDSQAPATEVEATLARARTLTEGVSGCTDFAAIAEENGTPQPSEPARFQLKDLAPQLREIVQDQPIGQPSEPIRQPAGVQVVMVCERQQNLGPDRDQIRQTLLRERVGMLSRRYLRDLRRAAFVDLRV